MDASKIIDEKIASLTDWRGALMKALRKLIHEVDPKIVEEWKWMGTPVFNRDGIVCCVNAHKSKVKMTFIKGAKLNDPKGLFNAELEGNARRAIDWSEGDAIQVEGLKGLIRDAIALNGDKPSARKAGGASSVTAKTRPAKKPAVKTATPKKKPAAKKPAAKKPAPTKKSAATRHRLSA